MARALLLVGFVVTLLVTFTSQYNVGVGARDTWAREGSRECSSTTSPGSSPSSESGALAGSMTDGLGALYELAPDPQMLAFIAACFIGVVAFGLLRLRIPRWPPHPVLLVGIFMGRELAGAQHSARVADP